MKSVDGLKWERDSGGEAEGFLKTTAVISTGEIRTLHV